MKYFVHRQGGKHGPYTIDNLKTFVASGNIDPRETVVSEDGSQQLTVSNLLSGPAPATQQSPLLPGPPPDAMNPLHRHLSTPQPAQPHPQKAGFPGWAGIVIAVAVVIGSAVGLYYFKKFGDALENIDEWLEIDEGNVELSEVPLLEDRENHSPRWVDSSYESDGDLDVPPAEVFEIIRYPSPAGELAAYLTPDPGDGKRHPAMVWAKGGFGGVGSYLWEPARRTNDQSARAFREAGIVLMCPSWRAENDNPGQFEMFYGEVDDLLAAIAYVRSLPYVDPERVYIGGHSTGGTISLLAAATGLEVRAAFPFGGEPDFTGCADWDIYDLAPYNRSRKRDNNLRSAIRYTKFIRTPTFYFEGGEAFSYSAEQMGDIAKENSVPFEAFELPGDHFDVLRPTTELIAKKILADTGRKCSITFTISELRKAYDQVHSISLASELKRWEKLDLDLEEVLENLGEQDSVPGTVADVRALRDAIKKLSGEQPAGKTVKSLARLAGLGDDVETQEIADQLTSMAGTELRKWVRDHIRDGSEIPADTHEDALAVLQAVAWQGEKRDGELVALCTLSGFAPDSWRWGGVFKAIYTEDEGFAGMMEKLSSAPPSGTVGSCLVERANRAYLDDEWEGKHPYDNPAGAAVLSSWLEPPGEGEDAEGAFSAALALAFVTDATRGDLTEKAMRHPDIDVQMEGAWADVKGGGEAGIGYLQKACEKLDLSVTAQSYLRELEREDAIPAAAKAPEFAAKAKMVNWLKHPNELGSPPPSIELFDQRELDWPPAESRIPVWLFKFTYTFDEGEPVKTGYGMVGSMTWSSFTEFETEPKPADLYVHHCKLELNRSEEDAAIGEEEARAKLAEKNPGVFEG